MTPQMFEELQREQQALALARDYTIEGSLEEQTGIAEQANEQLKDVKRRKKHIEEMRDGFVEPAKQIIANARAWFDPAIKSLGDAETFLKDQLTDYTQREQRRIAEARRIADAAAAEARRKADADAAAARARAQEEARQKERAAQEARQKAEAARAAGDDAAAKRAAAEAAKREEEAHQAVQKGEERAQAAVMTASVTTIVPREEKTKLKGFSTSTRWCCELPPGSDEKQALRAMVAAIAGVDPAKLVRTDLLALLERCEPACNKLAAALKSDFNVPGLVAREVTGARSVAK